MKVLLFIFGCFLLAALPVRAQDSCPLPARMTAGGGGRIAFSDGSPHLVLTYPGVGPLVAIYFEGYSFVLTDHDPVCVDGVLWWEINTQTQNTLWMGWIAEGADGVYFIEPLPRDQAQANVVLRTSLLYWRLWGVVERDSGGIFISYHVPSPRYILTSSQHGLISDTYNALFYWNKTGLYRTNVVDDDQQLLKGDQTNIVDISYSDYKSTMAVLYAEDCQLCYALYSLQPTVDTSFEKNLIWRGKTAYPLTKIEGWIFGNETTWVLRQDTERAQSPYPASGGELLAVSPTQGLVPLQSIPGSDQAMSYSGQWLATISDSLNLIKLDTRETYNIPLQYGDIGALPIFSSDGNDLVWFEIDFKGDKPQTVTLRNLDIATRRTSRLFTFDVRDGRLPTPGVVLSSSEFTLLYHGSLMLFDMTKPESTTWFPTPTPDLLGVIWIGD